MSDVTVPQTVQRDAGQPGPVDQTLHGPGDRVGMPRIAGRVREHQAGVGPAGPGQQANLESLGDPDAGATLRPFGGRGRWCAGSAPTSGPGDGRYPGFGDDRLTDGEAAGVDVDVGPAQPAQLTPPQSGHGRRPDQCPQMMLSGLLEEHGQLLGCSTRPSRAPWSPTTWAGTPGRPEFDGRTPLSAASCRARRRTLWQWRTVLQLHLPGHDRVQPVDVDGGQVPAAGCRRDSGMMWLR